MHGKWEGLSGIWTLMYCMHCLRSSHESIYSNTFLIHFYSSWIFLTKICYCCFFMAKNMYIIIYHVNVDSAQSAVFLFIYLFIYFKYSACLYMIGGLVYISYHISWPAKVICTWFNTNSYSDFEFTLINCNKML